MMHPYAMLARYERLSLLHQSAGREQPDASGNWRGIGFRVAQSLLLCRIEEISELLAVPAITPVPGARPWLLGVINVRGNLTPTIDLTRFLFGEHTQCSDRTRMLIVWQGHGHVALLVDEVLGQRTMSEQQRALARPEENVALMPYADGQLNLNGQLFSLFGMGRLVRAPAFRQAAA